MQPARQYTAVAARGRPAVTCLTAQPNERTVFDLCSRCGRRMSIVAVLNDAFAIRQILDDLGLSTAEAEKPPPLREVLRVAEHGEGWGVPAEWE